MLDKTKEYLGYCPNEQDLMPGNIVDGEIEHIVSGVKVIAPLGFHLMKLKEKTISASMMLIKRK